MKKLSSNPCPVCGEYWWIFHSVTPRGFTGVSWGMHPIVDCLDYVDLDFAYVGEGEDQEWPHYFDECDCCGTCVSWR